MKHARIALLACLAILSLPVALACHGQYAGVRPPHLEKEYYFSWGQPAATEGAGLWEETNGLVGLQCEPTRLSDGTIVPPDDPVL